MSKTHSLSYKLWVYLNESLWTTFKGWILFFSLRALTLPPKTTAESTCKSYKILCLEKYNFSQESMSYGWDQFGEWKWEEEKSGRKMEGIGFQREEEEENRKRWNENKRMRDRGAHRWFCFNFFNFFWLLLKRCVSIN